MSFGKSKDVLSTQLAFTGSYLVRLKGDVTHCAYTANTDSTEGDGEATTYQATAYGNDYVGVVTTTSAGAAADKKFNLIVACTA